MFSVTSIKLVFAHFITYNTYLLLRAVGKSENQGRHVVIVWALSPSPLQDTGCDRVNRSAKIWGGGGKTPCPLFPTALCLRGSGSEFKDFDFLT